MRITLLLLMVAWLGVGCQSSRQQNTSKEKLSAKEFSQSLRTTKNPQLIDVRSAEEFSGGHVEHAMNIDWNGTDFQNRIAPLRKSEPVFLYCLSGGRSSAAAASLREQGFEKVYEMPGGMMEWRKEKLPEAGVARMAGLSFEQYESLLSADKLTLVDFYADWCGPCKKMEPYLKKLEVELKDKIILVRIDADRNPELCEQLDVTALPTLKLYRNKELTWSNVGYINEAGVRKQLN